jgi:hypothetical protein
MLSRVFASSSEEVMPAPLERNLLSTTIDGRDPGWTVTSPLCFLRHACLSPRSRPQQRLRFRGVASPGCGAIAGWPKVPRIGHRSSTQYPSPRMMVICRPHDADPVPVLPKTYMHASWRHRGRSLADSDSMSCQPGRRGHPFLTPTRWPASMVDRLGQIAHAVSKNCLSGSLACSTACAAFRLTAIRQGPAFHQERQPPS